MRVGLQFPKSCCPNVAVDQLHYTHGLLVELLVFSLSDVTGIERGGQMISKLVRRTSALPAELHVLLVGKSPVSLCQIRRN